MTVSPTVEGSVAEALAATYGGVSRNATAKDWRFDAEFFLAAAKEHGLVVTASEEGLDAAWKEAEAALPEGWAMAGVSRGGSPLHFRQWVADAVSEWHRSDRSREMSSGYGPTPAAALRALAERLRR